MSESLEKRSTDILIKIIGSAVGFIILGGAAFVQDHFALTSEVATIRKEVTILEKSVDRLRSDSEHDLDSAYASFNERIIRLEDRLTRTP